MLGAFKPSWSWPLSAYSKPYAQLSPYYSQNYGSPKRRNLALASNLTTALTDMTLPALTAVRMNIQIQGHPQKLRAMFRTL